MTAYTLCGFCHSLRGGPIASVGGVQVHQLCHCATTDEHVAQPRIGDHNTKLELCRCCAVEAPQSGTRWSVWFCGECKPRITALNQRSGRCVVPIGRHSLMNRVFYDPDPDVAVGQGAAVHPDDRVALPALCRYRGQTISPRRSGGIHEHYALFATLVICS